MRSRSASRSSRRGSPQRRKYRWVLERKLTAEVAALRKLGEGGRTVLLLDY
jgi:hypothetical protein